MDCEQLYAENEVVIQANWKKYQSLSEEKSKQLLAHIEKGVQDDDDDEEQMDQKQREFLKDQEHLVDLMEQAGKPPISEKEQKPSRYFLPKKIPTDDLLKNLEILNEKQRQIVMHIYKCFKTQSDIYLAGSAGVGKSKVIETIYQIITHYLDNLPGGNPETIKVLLTAFAGKAAILINGTTIHTAFALPVKRRKDAKSGIPQLSDDVANTIRANLIDLGLGITDEISMVDNIMFSEMHTRLVQITGQNEPFGRISIIVVGDLLQLPPVRGQMVFMPPKDSDTAIFSNLWGNFKYFELTEIMRQKDEQLFITALNNLAVGKMSSEDIKLFESRVVSEDRVPTAAIRLFHANKDVDSYNNERISNHPGNEYLVEAVDSVDKNIPERKKAYALNSLRKRTIHDQGNLPNDLRLKVGIKYMISVNINIKDGLVNGACGTLRYIQHENGQPKMLFIEFPANVGAAAKSEVNHTMINVDGFCNDWVPIQKVTNEIYSDPNNIRLFRQQFPLVPAISTSFYQLNLKV
ncbi:ATP-dependent DNA helicase PIF1-like, partial [Sitodiplosis mosellana]|uniref:ATP-dependent DNA helicase PIF1-like n=1 Tax=Sitodiplosis mosellana TaxID=263140 RepID=UPI0024444F86